MECFTRESDIATTYLKLLLSIFHILIRKLKYFHVSVVSNPSKSHLSYGEVLDKTPKIISQRRMRQCIHIGEKMMTND